MCVSRCVVDFGFPQCFGKRPSSTSRWTHGTSVRSRGCLEVSKCFVDGLVVVVVCCWVCLAVCVCVSHVVLLILVFRSVFASVPVQPAAERMGRQFGHGHDSQ